MKFKSKYNVVNVLILRVNTEQQLSFINQTASWPAIRMVSGSFLLQTVYRSRWIARASKYKSKSKS